VEKKVKKGSGYGLNWKTVKKNSEKRVWLWIELENSGKKKVKKGSGYGLNWKTVKKNSGKKKWKKGLAMDWIEK